MLAAVAASQGRGEDCRRLSHEALATATRLRLAVVAAVASWTLALLDLTDGHPMAALDRMQALATPGHPTARRHRAAGHRHPGRGGRPRRPPGRHRALRGPVRAVGQEGPANLDPTGRPSLPCPGHPGPGRRAALPGRAGGGRSGELVWELARTELLYGEWLRRARRRADARGHLRAALEAFERLGAVPWAERTRVELRASGETARRRDPSTLSQLTPQERQVARLANQGLTNQQIADRLFLSRHTVGYHLHKIYTKLGITSRADLRRLDEPDGHGG
jgi:DNA-binding CsgD family transcriptional regulator